MATAIDIKLELLGKHPEVAYLFLRLAHTSRSLGQNKAATDAYRHAYQIVGDASQSEMQEAKKARSRDPSFETAYFLTALNLIETLESAGHTAESTQIKRAMRARGADVRKPDINAILNIIDARDLLQNGELEKSYELAQSVLENLDQQNHDRRLRFRAFLLQANSLIAKKRFAAAQALLRTSNPPSQRRRQSHTFLQREWGEAMIHLYDAWNKPRQANTFRNRLLLKSLDEQPEN